jgi:endoglycosylceramidase
VRPRERLRPGTARRAAPALALALALALSLPPLACQSPPASVVLPDRGAGAPDLRSAAPEASMSWPARWHVSRGFVRDAQGRALIMRGVNVSNRHKQKPYFDFHQQADYERARTSWGFNAVRFVLQWAAIEPSRGGYDDAYLDQLARRMDWTQKAGLLVVLDMHQDLYGHGFSGGNGAPAWACDESLYRAHVPKVPWFANYASPQVMACFDKFFTSDDLQQRYAEAWRRVARRLKGYAHIVGFDVMNEPHWGSYSIFDFERDRMQPLYHRVITAVRAEAPGWVAFLEPSVGRGLGVRTSLQPSAHTDLVYAPHSYDGNAELGQGFSADNRQFLISRIADFDREARKLSAALWIGEYGGNPDHKGIFDYMDAQYDGAAAVAASTVYWHYGKGRGYELLDPDGEERKALLDVLVRPYPRRVAGDPISYHFDHQSRRFTLTYTPLAAVTAATEIAVPARVYSAGYRVGCQGCSSTRISGGLRITSPPGDRPATVTISP